MLNIVVPMAGAGSRFARAGFSSPKPLIMIDDEPMISLVIRNLRPAMDHKFIFICQRDHVIKYDLNVKLKKWAPGCEIVVVDGLTEGAACTVLSAKELINNEFPLMIANSDQFIDVSIDDYLLSTNASASDGLIMTMSATDPKWSFIRYDNDFLVKEVAEKVVISHEATVGVYNFSRGQDFISAAEEMIENDIRVNNEFYVAPVYNILIERGARIKFFNVGSERSGMYGLGIPDDLEYFMKVKNNLVCYQRAR